MSNQKFRCTLQCHAGVFISTGVKMTERKSAIENYNNMVVSEEPLNDDSVFEILIEHINEENNNSSLEFGATSMKPTSEVESVPTGEAPVTESSFDSKYVQKIDMSRLKVGDRLRMMREGSHSLQFYLNNEQFGSKISDVPEELYAVVNCCENETTSSVMAQVVNPEKPESSELNTEASPTTFRSCVTNLQKEEEEGPNNFPVESELLENSLSVLPKLDEVDTIELNAVSRVVENVSVVQNAINVLPDTTTQSTATVPQNVDNMHSLISNTDTINMEFPLSFHHRCGLFVKVSVNGRSAFRPNAFSEFNNAVVFTNRPLRNDELFEIKLEKIVQKWGGSLEIGLTHHFPHSVDLPTTVTNLLSKTLVFCGNSIVRNGVTICDNYPFSTDNLKKNDKIAVTRKGNGNVHFYVNGRDLGVADRGFDGMPFGIVDVYGRAAKISIVTQGDDSVNASDQLTDRLFSNALQTIRNIEKTLSPSSSDSLLFDEKHHGKYINVTTDGKMAFRENPNQQFNNAILFSNRPLQDGEVFEIEIEDIVTTWVGSIEIGVTSRKPNEVCHLATMTDVTSGAWILSGNCLLHGGTYRNYSIDIDQVDKGSKLGIKWTKNGNLYFYKDGKDGGVAAMDVPEGAYGFFDLYGRCTKVKLCEHNQACNSSSRHASFFSAKAVLTAMTPSSVVATKEESTCHVVYTSYLRENQRLKVKIKELDVDCLKSMTVGLSTSKSLNRRVFQSCWKWQGNQILNIDDEVIHDSYGPSLYHLQVGCSISIGVRNDSTLHFYVNDHDMGVAAVDLPPNLYPFVVMHGCIKCIQMEVEDKSHPHCACTVLSNPVKPREFNFDSCQCGSNIKLNEDYYVATRLNSYKHGLVFTSQSFLAGSHVKFKCTAVDERFNGSFRIGLSSIKPTSVVHESSIYRSRCDVWIDKNQIYYSNKLCHYIPISLDSFKLGCVIKIWRDDRDNFYLQIDNDTVLLWYSTTASRSYYLVLDVYGSCKEITMFTSKLEK